MRTLETYRQRYQTGMWLVIAEIREREAQKRFSRQDVNEMLLRWLPKPKNEQEAAYASERLTELIAGLASIAESNP